MSLLDRMVRLNLRSAAAITAEGLRLLKALDEPVLALHRAQLGRLSRQQLADLIELLTIAREDR